MSKVSKPVWVLIIVAILAVGAAVVGVITVGTLMIGRRQARKAETAQAEGIFEVLRQDLNKWSAADSQESQPPEGAGAGAIEAAPPEGSLPNDPEQPAETPTESKVQILGQGNVVITRSGPDRVEMTFSTSPKAEEANLPRPATMVPSQRQVRKLQLTDEQKEQVEAYDNEFRPLAGARREDLKLRMEAAFQAVRDAQEAEDTQAEATARQGIRNMIGEQSKVMKQLDEQYLEGLRPILTEEQAGELDRSHRPAGAAFGYVEVKGPDGRSTFKIVKPGRDSVFLP